MPTRKQNQGFIKYPTSARSLILGTGLGLVILGLAGRSSAQVTVVIDPPPAAAEGYAERFQSGVNAYRRGQYRHSFKIWLPLARAGDPSAQYNIAHHLLRGLGVQKTTPEALPWLLQAAQGGVTRAYTQLGIIHATEPSLARDYRRAARYFYAAARQNDTRAQYNLGLMYEYGLGVEADRNIAAIWYNFAAQAGHRRAINRMKTLEISFDRSGEYPPAPQFNRLQMASSVQPRVVDPSSRSSRQASEGLQFELAEYLRNEGETLQNRLPASESVKDWGEGEKVKPAAQPDKTFLNIDAVEPSSPAAPETLAGPSIPRPSDVTAQDVSLMAVAAGEHTLPRQRQGIAVAIEVSKLQPVQPVPEAATELGAPPKAEKIAPEDPARGTGNLSVSAKGDERRATETLQVRSGQPAPISAAAAMEPAAGGTLKSLVNLFDAKGPDGVLRTAERNGWPVKFQNKTSFAPEDGQRMALVAINARLGALAIKATALRSGNKTGRQTSLRSRERRAALQAYQQGKTAQALQLWSILANRGDRVGIFWLGRLYNRGEGVSRDPGKAYALIRIAARKGYSPAVTALANLQARLSSEELKALEKSIPRN